MDFELGRKDWRFCSSDGVSTDARGMLRLCDETRDMDRSSMDPLGVPTTVPSSSSKKVPAPSPNTVGELGGPKSP